MLSPWRGRPHPPQPQVACLCHPFALPSQLLCDPDSTRLASHIHGALASEASGFRGLSPDTPLIQDRLQVPAMLVEATWNGWLLLCPCLGWNPVPPPCFCCPRRRGASCGGSSVLGPRGPCLACPSPDTLFLLAASAPATPPAGLSPSPTHMLAHSHTYTVTLTDALTLSHRRWHTHTHGHTN